MEIKYLNSKQTERKISSNMNNAIKNCTGDIIKYMCGDDFFIDDTALDRIQLHFKANTDAKWLIMGSVHCHSIHSMHTRIVPFYHDKIHLGGNTISSPSVIATTVKEHLDEKLSMLVDCELYKRLYVKYGKPIIMQEPLVCNRIHPNQQQNSLQHVIEQEREYCISLYGE
jgi:glycosyltransferase involved in cell wall biosynthesis